MPVLLLLFVAVVPVLVGVSVAGRPVTTARVEAFARRHHLEPTPGTRVYVAAYLSHVRRWRVGGALGGYLVGLASTLPQERVALQFLPVLAGWFLGAVVAEFRFRAPPGADAEVAVLAPRWLLRVPHILAAATVGGTALVLAFGRAGDRSGRVLAWGAGALVCAALVAAVGSRAGRQAHAIGVLTAVGSCLVVSCLAQQATVVHDRFFDAAGTAVGGIALLWTVGGVSIAWLLATAAWRGASAGPAPVLFVVATLVAVSAGWAGFAWWRDHPPYPASAVHATATLRFTDAGRFAGDARALGITGLGPLVDEAGQQQFVGRVDYTRPAGAAAGGGTYHVIVIDKRRNQVASWLSGTDGGGWSSRLSELAGRYPWLSATAPVVSDTGYSFRGSAVSAAADAPGPMTFVGSLPDPAALSLSDLLVVLVLTGPDQQTYWATRVSG